MSSVTVRNLPEATHRALKQRAAQHGRSTEAEIRHILEAAVRPGLSHHSARWHTVSVMSKHPPLKPGDHHE